MKVSLAVKDHALITLITNDIENILLSGTISEKIYSSLPNIPNF